MTRATRRTHEDGKLFIRTMVGQAGGAIASVVKALEKEGAAISNEDFDKVFVFLRTTLATLEGQARKDRTIINAGQFDFDMKIEPGPKLNPVSEMGTIDAGEAPKMMVTLPSPAPTNWVKPTGRIAKNSPNKDLAGKAVHIPLKTEVAPSTLDGVGVVGDKSKPAGPVGFLGDE